MTLTLKQKTVNDIKFWEGTVSIPGLTTAKLTSKSGVALFATRSALTAAARAFAKRFNVQFDMIEPQVKKAARKVKKTAVVAE